MINSTFGTLPSGAVHTSPVNKKKYKKANPPSKTKPVDKASVFATKSVGIDATPYAIPPLTRGADYYRYGKYKPDSEMEIEAPPKFFQAVKDDYRFPSSLRVYGQATGDDKPKDYIPAYTKFLLESTSTSHTERSQIVETFGDFYVFMFGERPPVYNFSGQLINSKMSNWAADFDFMYENYLRGTKCVERNSVVIMSYGGKQIQGLMLNSSTSTAAVLEGAVAFQFSVVVFKKSFFKYSDDFGFTTDDNKSLTEDTNFRELLANLAPDNGEGSSQQNVSLLHKHTTGVMGGRTPAQDLLNMDGNNRTSVA